MLAAHPMAAHREAFVFGLVPGVRATLIVQPRLNVCRIVSEDGKCRNAVFPVVLKLVVAPDNTEIGLKLIERAARAAKTSIIAWRCSSECACPSSVPHC